VSIQHLVDKEAGILLHIPHASAEIPPETRGSFLLSEQELRRELLKVTDWYTDELFSLEAADRLVFPVSRLVVDPERFSDDRLEVMAASGLGAVYSNTHDGRPLKRVKNRDALLNRYYAPHHESLNAWTRRTLSRHGKCLIIDCHSFPASALPCDLDQTPERPEFCLGSDPIHTPPALVEATSRAIRKSLDATYSVLENAPYRGSMVPSDFYGRDSQVASIMIEIRRDLYMDEHTGAKLETFALIQERMTKVLESLVEAWSGCPAT
jgi:N-formylglutamate amidohydrolase